MPYKHQGDREDTLPFISTVVPVYNGESTIQRCLDSIMMMEYPRKKIEVIVVDDGSTDKTIEIVNDYSVKLVRSEHKGYPSAMNTGIRVSGGEVVVNVDSDTYVSADWLTKIVKEFKDPNVGIASGYIATALNSSFWAKMRGYESGDRYDEMPSKYVDFVTSTCTAYRRRLLTEVGLFDEELLWNCDEDLAHRAAKAGWKIVLQKNAVCYHEWEPSFKGYFKKQIVNGKFFVKNLLKYPELFRGKKMHPLSLYIPMILTLLTMLIPLLFLVNYAWLSGLSFLGLILYHLPKTVRILRKHHDWTMVFFPIAVNTRYVAWLIGLTSGILGEAKGSLGAV